MVAILVLLTFIAFFLIEWYLHRRGTAMREAEISQPVAPPAIASEAAPTLFHHPGHSWVRVLPNGRVSIGASSFASSFAGRIASIELPREGSRLRQGYPAWTLVSRRKRRLTQVMPVDGEVVEVNRALLDRPRLAQLSPYGAGWILRVQPRRLREALQSLLRDGLAETLNDATRIKVTAMLSPLPEAVANDGGEWVPGFGDVLDDEDWEAIRRELFPAADESLVRTT